LNDTNNKSPDIADPELEDINRLENDVAADNFRSTTTIQVATRAVTTVDVGRPGRVASNNTSQSRAAATVTVSRMPSSFVTLDFEAIRQGFLEGGVKSTDGNSINSMSGY
jgi:hypothetical protein